MEECAFRSFTGSARPLLKASISRHLVVWIIVIANRVRWGVVWHVRDSNSLAKSSQASVWIAALLANSGSRAQMRLRGHHLGTAAD
jgi:hypothetical protein